MKNIQVIDGALNSVYDIFAATEEEFALIFPAGQDVAFIDEVLARGPGKQLDEAFDRIWERRVPKREAMGIHGVLFYELEHKNGTTQPDETRKPSILMVRGFDDGVPDAKHWKWFQNPRGPARAGCHRRF